MWFESGDENMNIESWNIYFDDCVFHLALQVFHFLPQLQKQLKHTQEWTSHHMLTHNLTQVCHNTSLENVHEL